MKDETTKDLELITPYELKEINILMSNYSLSLEDCITWLESHRAYFNTSFQLAADLGEE
jgi:hypothetical protein